jgi:hypothetical protein
LLQRRDSEAINKRVFQEFLNLYTAAPLGNNADLLIMVARIMALTTSQAGEILLTTRSSKVESCQGIHSALLSAAN